MKILRFTSAGWSGSLLRGSVFPWRAVALGVGGYFLLSTSTFPQGDLKPPGAPTPTMKTLDQIDTHIDVKGEKRVDLQNAPASAVDTTNAGYHFIINQPGSYYLSANLGVTRTNGIQINAEGVTLDLNGFEISRASGTAGNGIEIAHLKHRASIRNGSIKGFAYGINFFEDLNTAKACSFRDLSVGHCTGGGITTGPGAVLESCRAHDNTGLYAIYAFFGSSLSNCTANSNTTLYGIQAQAGSSLTNCTAQGNTTDHGIVAGPGSVLTNCSATNNKSNSNLSTGINAGSGCTISHCSAYGNSSTAGTLTAATGIGFLVGGGSTILGCSALQNGGDGIRIQGDVVARDNTCFFNGTISLDDGAGIHALNSSNRIEGNNVTGNKRGIDVSAAGNLIIKNSARNNGVSSAGNYVIVADNRYGPIIDDTATGSISASGKGPFTSTLNTVDPWANISY